MNYQEYQKTIRDKRLAQSLSPYMQAVKKLFEKQDLSTGKEQLTAILVGGAAVNWWTQARVSRDVDAEFGGTKGRLILDSRPLVYLDDDGEEKSVYLDTNYNPGLALAQEDYASRTVFIGVWGSLKIFVMAPVDVAISKMGRWGDRDQQDIKILANHGLVDPKELEKYGKEAIEFAVGYGMKSFLRDRLAQAIEIIKVADRPMLTPIKTTKSTKLSNQPNEELPKQPKITH